jgi:hypothetical protein
MKKYKEMNDYNITDVLFLKNNYLILASCENKFNPCLRIYDEFYENEIHVIPLIEGNNETNKHYQYTIKKLELYNISNTKDDLFIVCSDKFIRNYKINYLSKVIKKTGLNITIEFNSKYILAYTLDMAILNDYNNYFLFVSSKELYFWKYNEKFNVNDENTSSINISKNDADKTYGDIFIFDKKLFIVIGYKSSIYFLYVIDNYLKQFKWGKEIEIKCEPNKNYMKKLNDKNVLFWNNYLNEINVIYIPTEEIVTKCSFSGISSICNINNTIYLCSKNGLEEIEFSSTFLELGESNKKYKNVTLIKPINKGYVCFATTNSFFICQ